MEYFTHKIKGSASTRQNGLLKAICLYHGNDTLAQRNSLVAAIQSHPAI